MVLKAHYQRALELSEQMLAAGKAQAWEELAHLEDKRSILLAHLPTAKGSDKAELAELIRKIQGCDSELREYLEAWMQHARILLRQPLHPVAERHQP